MKKSLLLISLIAITLKSGAQTGTYVPQLAAFDNAMQSLMTQYNVPGGQLAITYHGRLVYNRGFGFADVAASDSVQPNSIFRVASVSKPITGIAVMKMYEQGLINLDAKVFGTAGILNSTAYSAYIDSRVEDITVRQLLQHSGGWNSAISGDPMFNAYNIATTMGATPPAEPQTVIQYVLTHQMLDFAPGAEYQYSNFGFCILAKVIETITGQSYEDYVINNVLLPANVTGMHLGFNQLANILPHEVHYYDYPGAPSGYSVYSGLPTVPQQYGGFNIEAMDGNGRWVGSAVDLCKLMLAVDQYSTKPDILNAATEDTMIAPSVTNPNYAMGWNVNIYHNWWHLGSIPGTTAEIIRNGNNQINFAVLFNSRTQNVSDVSGAADNILWSVLPTITSWPSGDQLTGISEKQSSFELFPNPASADVKISSSELIKEIKVKDIWGNEVLHLHPEQLTVSINISTLSNGIYFITSYSAAKTNIHKVIVAH